MCGYLDGCNYLWLAAGSKGQKGNQSFWPLPFSGCGRREETPPECPKKFSCSVTRARCGEHLMTPKNLIIYLNCEKFRQMATLSKREDEKEGNNTSRLTWSETKEDCRFVCARTVNKSQAWSNSTSSWPILCHIIGLQTWAEVCSEAKADSRYQYDIPVWVFEKSFQFGEIFGFSFLKIPHLVSNLIFRIWFSCPTSE